MYKKITAVAMVAVLAAMTASAAPIFYDDFEAYAVDSSAVAADMGNNWFPSSDPAPVAQESRIFNTAIYDDSNLWISLVDGTSITSRGIDVPANSNLVFSAALVAETATTGRAVDCTYDLLLGTDAGTAVSLIGGPVTVVAVGDNGLTAGSGVGGTYADQMTTQAFNTGTVGAGDKLFIEITRVGVTDGHTGAFFGVDDVQVVPEPATLGMVAMFGGAMLFIRRKMMI